LTTRYVANDCKNALVNIELGGNMNYKALAILLGALSMSACGRTPEAQCIAVDLMALGEAGIHGGTKAEHVVALQCDMVKQFVVQRGCSVKDYRFMTEQPEQALRMFAPGTKSFSPGDIESLRGPAQAVSKACDW
jgi:hypothetical protein